MTHKMPRFRARCTCSPPCSTSPPATVLLLWADLTSLQLFKPRLVQSLFRRRFTLLFCRTCPRVNSVPCDQEGQVLNDASSRSSDEWTNRIWQATSGIPALRDVRSVGRTARSKGQLNPTFSSPVAGAIWNLARTCSSWYLGWPYYTSRPHFVSGLICIRQEPPHPHQTLKYTWVEVGWPEADTISFHLTSSFPPSL